MPSSSHVKCRARAWEKALFAVVKERLFVHSGFARSKQRAMACEYVGLMLLSKHDCCCGAYWMKPNSRSINLEEERDPKS
jgi:hypothetical protein